MEENMETEYETNNKYAYVTDNPEMIAIGAEILGPLLACLRAMAMSYQTSHWTAHGSHFYQDHLLFERLYNSVSEEIDGLAEKIAGVMGCKQLKLEYQAPLIMSYLAHFSVIPDPFRRGLESEHYLQNLINQSIEDLKGFGLLTLGLEDLLIEIANNHEENMYLLQQVLEPRVAKKLSRDRVVKSYSKRKPRGRK